MEHPYKQLGPFVYGDPRFLAGGSTKRSISYTDMQASLCDGDAVCPPGHPVESLRDAMARLGQRVSNGKTGYHGSSETNSFVLASDLDWPTVGVEVETILRDCTDTGALQFSHQCFSNWFKAEGDGSLDHLHHGTYGYELVTTVLPARLYRNLELWTGFSNLVSPFVMSYKSSETGLHVHVGTNVFETAKFPYAPTGLLPLLGKLLATKVYYSLIPRPFARRVFLRGSDQGYCHETNDVMLTSKIGPCRASELVSDCIRMIITNDQSIEDRWANLPSTVVQRRSASGNPIEYSVGRDVVDKINQGCGLLSSGHHTEVNADPHLTLEFRRGKGTTNPISIHRMVELCTLVVMYARRIIETPDMTVSTEGLMEYLVEQTASEALRLLAKRELDSIVAQRKKRAA